MKSGSRSHDQCRGSLRSGAASAEVRWTSWACDYVPAALGVEPGLRPGLIGSLTAEFDAVVQAERAIVSELEAQGRDAPAAPPLRARHFADDVLGRVLRDRLLERKATFQGFGLFRGPGAELSLFGAGGEIGVRLGIAHRRHSAAD